MAQIVFTPLPGRKPLADRTGRRSLEKLKQHRERQAEYRAANRKMLLEKQKAYAARPEVKAARLVKYRQQTIRFLLVEARKRARQKNLAYNLKIEDLAIPEVCPVLGIPIIVNGPRDNWPSIDRHVPELGYVVGNVEIISHRANILKNSATLAEVEKILKYMQLKSWWDKAFWVSQ